MKQSPRSDAEIALGVFTAAFAASVLFDWGRLFGNLYQGASFWHALAADWPLHVTCSVAVWVLLRPTSLLRLAALATATLLHIAYALPDVFNHSIFAVFVCLGLLASLAQAAPWRGGDAHRRVYENAAPVLRVSLLVLYVWVTIHKLNWDFFDSSMSCATAQLFQIQDRWPWLPVPTPLLPLAMAGTLAIEAALPLGLVSPRWRRHALLLGGVFHLPLALHYPGFSVMLIAIYSLFVPRELWAQSWERLASRGWPAQGLLRAPLAQAVAWASLCALAIVFFGERGFGPHRRSDLAFAVFAATLGLYLVRLWPALGWKNAEPLFAGSPMWMWLLPALLAANGALPHLGVKNTQSFAMFSNLRTEGGTTNHVFLPVGLQFSDNLRDVVRIERANDPVLQRLARPLRGDGSQGVLMPRSYKRSGVADLSVRVFWLPYEGLRNRISELASRGAGNVQVAYVRGNASTAVDDAERSAELASASWLQRKLLRMRPVPLDGPALCMW